MSKDPAILFYTGDFLNGCTDLTFEERGQYITLLCLQHQKGHLSEKTIRLSLGSVSDDVMNKFQKDEDGLYFNERMDIEIEKRTQFVETRRNNGKLGGRPIKPTGKPTGKPNEEPLGVPNGDKDENIIDYDNVIELYHNLCPNFSKVLKLEGRRKGYVHARLSEYGIEKVTEVLRKAGQSDFLNGKNDRAWKADFEWIMRPENFLKILEGKYDRYERIQETHDEYIKRIAGV